MTEDRNSNLYKHQRTMLDLIAELDRVCKKHDIEYVLYAGTLLGAVRHGGFVPWDDDMDVIMARDSYERFLQIADEELDLKRFFLQREFSRHWPMFYSKLRMNDTACMEKIHPKDAQMHQGIYIDIFPMDNLRDAAVWRMVQFVLSKLVIARSLDRRGYETDSLKKKAVLLMSRIVPAKLLWRFVIQRSGRNTKMVHAFFAGASKYSSCIFQREWFAETVLMEFEGKKYPVPRCYDEILTTLYGDYMTLPSEEERRCKQHNLLVDTEKSYTEYLEYQKKQKIDVFSRSIR